MTSSCLRLSRGCLISTQSERKLLVKHLPSLMNFDLSSSFQVDTVSEHWVEITLSTSIHLKFHFTISFVSKDSLGWWFDDKVREVWWSCNVIEVRSRYKLMDLIKSNMTPGWSCSPPCTALTYDDLMLGSDSLIPQFGDFPAPEPQQQQQQEKKK